MSASVALIGLLLFAAPEGDDETSESKSYDVGDLGLGEIDEQEKASDPAGSSGFGVGVTTTLIPTIGRIPTGGTVTTVSPNLSLRLWTGQLVIEPVFGFGFRSDDPTFLMTAGVLAGFALSDGNLRPILGGGVLLGLNIDDGPGNSSNTDVALTLGPMFGLEYRFESLKQLSLDAAIFLPLQFEFDPFVFSVGTAGGALVGFHYYFQ